MTVLDITPAGDAWIIDSAGDVLAIDASRVRLTPESLDRLHALAS